MVVLFTVILNVYPIKVIGIPSSVLAKIIWMNGSELLTAFAARFSDGGVPAAADAGEVSTRAARPWHRARRVSRRASTFKEKQTLFT